MRKKHLIRKGLACLTMALGLATVPGVYSNAGGMVDSRSMDIETVEDETVIETSSGAAEETGISYETNSSGSILGINLHGNPVIITAAETPEDSTSSSATYIYIYNDADKDGEIDEDEKPFTLDGEEVISYLGMPIYGIYNADDITEDIYITVDGVAVGSVYGINQGTSKGSVSINVKNGATINGIIYGVEQASAEGSVDINVMGKSTVAQIYGVDQNSIDGYVNVTVSDNSTINGAIYGVSQGTVKGKVSVEVTGSSSASAIYGVHGASKTENTVTIKADEATVSNIYGVYGSSEAKGSLTIQANGGTVSALYGVYSGSNIGGSVTIQADGGTVNQLFGVYYGSNAEGSLAISTSDATLTVLSGLGDACEAKGDLDIDVKNTTINGKLYATGYSSSGTVGHVGGNLTLSMDSSSSCGNCIYGAYNTAVDGDVTINADNNGSSYPYLYSVYYNGNSNNVTIGGNVELNVTGGKYYCVYGVFGNKYTNSSSETDYSIYVKGNVKATLSNAIMDSSDSSIYAVYGASVEGDVTLLTEEDEAIQCEGRIYGAYYALIKGNLNIDLYNENTGTNAYFVGAYCSSIGKNMDININGGSYYYIYGAYGSYSYSNGSYVPEYYINGDFNFNCNNLTCRSFLYGVYSNDIGGNATININTINNSDKYSLYNYALYYSVVHGKADINISGLEYAIDIYGIKASQVLNETEAGKVAGEDGYVNHVNISNATCTSSFYGMHESGASKSVNVKIDNIQGGTNTYICGVYEYSNYSLDGAISVDIKSCTASRLYGYYVDTSSSAASKTEDISINIEGCAVTNNLYGIYGGKFNSNVTVKSAYNIAKYKYMTNDVSSYKSLVVEASYENDESILDEDGNSLMDSYSFSNESCYYTVYSGLLEGTVKVNLNNINTNYFYGVAYNDTGATVDMVIKDSTFTSTTNSYPTSADQTSAYLYYPNSTTVSEQTVKANIALENVDFSGYANGIIANNTVANSDVAVTFDDMCTFAEDTLIIPSYNTAGKAVVTKGNDIYYGGAFVLDEDVTAENIYIGNYSEYESGSNTNSNSGKAVVTVSEGVILKATGNIYLPVCGAILNKGTVSGNIASTVEANDYNEGDIYGKIYVNGGSIEGSSEGVQFYYPVYISYEEKGGTVTRSGIVSITQDPDNVYALAGSEVSFVLTPYKGYYIESATVKHGTDAQADDMVVTTTTSTSTTYKFEMTKNYTYANLLFAGKQIVLGKTVADPVAILNETTTADEPLYDMADITITNDGKVGTVTYEVDDTYGLPQGLELVDGKIYGTPTVEYEDGKKTVIHVTGCNDTTAALTLNIIVSDEKKEQTSQDGRISIDEDNKIITLNGSSVVIEEIEAGTAIYIDDNKDGQADKTTPLYSGDLSEYTIKGISDTEVKKAFKITMNSGNVGTIYGAYASEMTVSSGDAIDIEILGGTVGTCYALADSTVEGTVREVLKSGNVTKKDVTTGTSSYTGAYYLYQNSGDVLCIYKTYVVDEDIEAKDLTVGDGTTVTEATFNGTITLTGTLTISKNGTAILKNKTTSDTLSMISAIYAAPSLLTIDQNAELIVNTTKISTTYASIKHKGTFECTGTFKNSGKWYVMDGTFADATAEQSYSNLYYPVSVQTDMTKASVAFNTNYVTEIDSIYYACKAGNVYITYSSIQGYDIYMTVNDGEPTLVTGTSASFTMPGCITSVVVDYVPTQISLSRKYADPVAKVGEEYTETSPLYDLTTLVIDNDTTSSYGSAVTYSIKKGTSLPTGLSLVDGKIVGTATTVNTTGTTTTFVVKGRNDTTAEININIVVQDTDYQEADLTDVVSVASSTIDLKGNSVVLIADASDSSKVAIYPDANHDGIADSSNSLKINGASSYDLSNYTIYGYKDVNKDSETGEVQAYEGDISIYVKGGTVYSIYGVYGTSTDKIVVDGKVTINVSGGKVSSNTVVATYADITESELILTGGTVGGKVYAADNSTIKNVNFQATDKIVIPLSTSMYVTNESTISGDVNAKVGTDSSYGFTKYSTNRSTSYFYGVADSNVKGNVNYIIDGKWLPVKVNNLVHSTDVAKDVNITWKGGNYGCGNGTSLACGFVYGETGTNANKIGNIYVNVTGEGADSISGSPYVVAGCQVSNVVYNGENVSRSATYISSNSETTLEGYLYANSGGAITIGGTYTINEDLNATTLNILDGANVTIAEGVTVKASSITNITGTLTNEGTLQTTSTATVSGALTNNGTLITDRTNATSISTSLYYITISGKLTNNGTWNYDNYITVANTTVSSVVVPGIIENNGTIKGTSTRKLTINSNCYVINNAEGSIELGYVSNGGTIVNYGKLSQTYNSTSVGNIYTTTTPTMYKALTNYSAIYYAVSLDYPAYCFEDSDTAPVSLESTYLVTSGIDGDTNQYIKGGATLNVNVTGTLKGENQAIESVTYGTEDTQATSSVENTWSVTALREPFTVTVNVVDKSAEAIALDKEADTVDNAVVGVTTTSDKPLYDLTDIIITNDTEVENGYVTYVVKSGNSLPDGLSLKDGKIYGTPTTASDTEQDVTIVIKGMNQTTAEFVLTFSKVAKGTPTLTLPTNIKTAVGTKLSEVSIPTTTKGTYEWADGDTIVTAADTDGDVYDAWFTPNDAANYDWSLLDKAVGTLDENGKVKVSLTVKTYKTIPEYTKPTDVTATYGDTLADVVIPEAENGTFEWMDTTLSVGNVGTATFKAKFVPNDTTTYESVNNIAITITIKPQPVEYTSEAISLVAHEGTTLSELELPEVENGKYQWVTSSSTVVEGSVTYKLGYYPEDTDNYDWSKVEGWSKSYKCVIVSVEVEVAAGEDHNYVEPYKYDDTYHWLECTCGEISDKAEHTWNDGEVTKKASATETGIKTYTCSVCGSTKSEEIPIDTSHKHSYDKSWKYDDTYHWHECGCGDITDKAEHTWNDGKVTKEPTTTETGVKTYTCTECETTKTEDIPVLENDGSGNNGAGSGSDDNNGSGTTGSTGGGTTGNTGGTTGSGTTGSTGNGNTGSGTADNTGNENTGSGNTDNNGTGTTGSGSTGTTGNKGSGTTATVDISKASSKIKVSGVTSQVYTGKKIKLSKLVVKAGNKTLKSGTDYTVSYKNNKNIGKATVTITGKGAYKGTIKKTFAIKAKKGKTYTVKKMKYKITKAAANGKGTVTLTGTTYKKSAKAFTKLKIGSTVTIGGVKFKVTAIGNNAFKGYKKLKSVTIGANVKTIGKNAFNGCKKLSKVTIGKKVTNIGAKAFYKCTALKTITIPASVKSIGASAFYGCKKLGTVTIKTKKLTTKKVGAKAFKGIKSNAKVKIVKSKYKAYKKFLSKKGLGKKVKYSKA